MFYDFIIAGGGLAGLSLACHMVRTSLRDRSILIVDRDPKKQNDRTWGFWASEATLFDPVVYRSWAQMQVVGEDDVPRRIPLGDYRYHVIRGIDFYEFARRDLAQYDSVSFLQGSVDGIVDGRDAAVVTVDGTPLYGRWVFDSLPHRLTDDVYQVLKMHFRGWEVVTPVPAFEAETLTFMDFRTPQAGEMRFFYVLPYAEDHALVEYTIFSKKVSHRSAYEAALADYLGRVLKVDRYRIVAQEAGAVPITDDPLERQLGKRVMAIGARAGRIKPSTGYAFMRVQKDCEEILDSLLLHGHPFDVPDDPDLYDVLDAVLLKVIHQHGDHLKGAFGAMFKRNPIEHILRFLDETSSPWENLMLIASMPPAVFLKAFVQVATSENLFDLMKG
ncbi:MAG: Lycopene cyclase [Anaerolineae bacterium]|nr:Lycopene cyclase [Anaerolineae bacterium]